MKRSAARAAMVLGIVVSFLVVPGAMAADLKAPGDRYLISAKSGADYAALKQEILDSGGSISLELPEIQTLVVKAPPAVRNAVAASSHVKGMAQDRVRTLVEPDGGELPVPGEAPRSRKINVNLGGFSPSAPSMASNLDPAFALPGLLWNLNRIHTKGAQKITKGEGVLAGVADTGVDYTHSELASRVKEVVDLTVNEDPPLCETYFGISDEDNALLYGGPADTDWHGHGSWIGGNMAGALDQLGLNGIAPKAQLVSLKIAQWCGYAYDSTMLDAFLTAGRKGIDVVNMSFGGYLDRGDPDQNFIYNLYERTVSNVRDQGTVIVSSAGNDHVRLGDGGRVLSHGSQTVPGDPVDDLFGLWEIPAGVPGVVCVSATGNSVAAPSSVCAPGTTDLDATCKPTSDAHQSYAVGKKNQLAYYSNYGPRIDVAAPGGARKFNIPGYDRGGSPGWPVTTADGTSAWETFSTISNWALMIPCYTITGGGFPADQCYANIQGTSMASPHAAAVIALIASANPAARHDPEMLIGLLKGGATAVRGNRIPPLSETDTSGGDLTGSTCPDGFCHLGGRAISDLEAYGAGLVDARRPLTMP